MPSLREASPTATPNGNASGINQYNNLQHLNYAKLYAKAMRDWFEKEVQFDRVFLFTEDSISIPASRTPIPTQPTYGNLRRFLRANFEKPLDIF